MIGIDSNLFLRWLLEDDKAKAAAVGKLVKKAEKAGERLRASDLVLAEVVWVLESGYDMAPREVAGYMQQLLDVPALEFENRDRLMQALELYRAHEVDFTDCYIAAWAAEKQLEGVASYDRDFDRLPVKRIEP